MWSRAQVTGCTAAGRAVARLGRGGCSLDAVEHLARCPTERPSSSATTPRPDGEDRAASSAARSEPPSARRCRRGAGPSASPRRLDAPRRGPSPAARAASSTQSTHRRPTARTSAPVARAHGAAPSASGSPGRPRRTARGSRGRGRRSRRRSRRPGRRAARPAASSWARMPPTRSTATWSPSLTASSMSWVTKTMVLPSSACRRRNSSWSWSRTTGSTAENGSSISITGGSAASARATPTRCCWPPESWAG